MAILLVIPARYESTRFIGKPLAELRGAGGVAKPLIQRSWEAAERVRAVMPEVKIVVATDNTAIADCVTGFGGEVVMTSAAARNGTERCAEAANGGDYELVINLQGDAPLTPPDFVTALVRAMRDYPKAAMATPVLKCDAGGLAALKQDRAEGRVGATTAVFDAQGRAMYFSKEVIPYGGGGADGGAGDGDGGVAVYHHVGVYAYRPQALQDYIGWSPCDLESAEGLEQLRFLSYGATVQCVEVAAKGRAFWEVNNPTDIARVEGMLADLGIN